MTELRIVKEEMARSSKKAFYFLKKKACFSCCYVIVLSNLFYTACGSAVQNIKVTSIAAELAFPTN